MVECFRHKAHVFGIGNDPAVVHRNAAAFLPPVLEGKKAVVSGIGGVYGAVGINSENTAFLARMFFFKIGYGAVFTPVFHYRPILFMTS